MTKHAAVPVDVNHPEYIAPGTEVQLSFGEHEYPGARGEVVASDGYHGVTMHKVRIVVETYVSHADVREMKLPDGTWQRVASPAPCTMMIHGATLETPPDYCDEDAITGSEYCERHLAAVEAYDDMPDLDDDDDE